MENLSLYQITNAFPALMESEEITEENKKQIKEELTVLQVASLSEVFTQDLEDMGDLLQQENENSVMTLEQATAIKLNFGKYKGLKLGDLVKQDPQYCDWLYSKNEKTDPVIKKALGIILDEITKAKEKKADEMFEKLKEDKTENEIKEEEEYQDPFKE